MNGYPPPPPRSQAYFSRFRAEARAYWPNGTLEAKEERELSELLGPNPEVQQALKPRSRENNDTLQLDFGEISLIFKPCGCAIRGPRELRVSQGCRWAGSRQESEVVKLAYLKPSKASRQATSEWQTPKP